jgi:hypothetical protein
MVSEFSEDHLSSSVEAVKGLASQKFRHNTIYEKYPGTAYP